MPPERSPKRQKTSSDTEATPSKTLDPSQIPLPSTPIPTSTTADAIDKQPQRSSWYSTWSRKAPSITQVTRDSINSASSAASEIASSIKDVAITPKSVRSPSIAMTLGKGRSSRASLANATTTMVHAEANNPARKSSNSLSTKPTDTQSLQEPVSKPEVVDTKTLNDSKSEEATAKEEGNKPDDGEQQPNQRSSWLGWLAKGDGAGTSQISINSAQQPDGEPAPVPDITKQDPPAPETESIQKSIDSQGIVVKEAQASRRGWLSIWGAENTDSAKAENSIVEPPKLDISDVKTDDGQDKANAGKSQNASAPTTEPFQAETSTPPSLPHDGTKASGWAFWSRDRKTNDSTTSIDRPHEGEIAVSDTPSQNQPRRASISVPKTQEEPKPAPKGAETKKSGTKQVEPKKGDTTNKKTDGNNSSSPEAAVSSVHKKQNSTSESTATQAESSNAKAVAIEPTENKKPLSIKTSKAVNNLLLPELYKTLKLPENPPFLIRLASLLYTAKEPELSHLSLVKDPPHIKNALAIGVHGYFPTPLIRSVLGQPTGTSIKFADMAAKSIKRWTSTRGYECQVKTAALEGEGKIAERIELLWKLLLNWIEEIRKSDFVMVACHSQGVPVAIMLVAKLIQFGCISSARVCICAMAGINMGPFQEYKSRWIGGSAGELFEFTNPTSQVSTDYRAALEVVLKSGVRLTFIGSIDDQLVSLESSLFSPISHPNIFRAVSIDSKIHAPSFLSHLVGFALKLRNIGVQDHGLIRELSSPLAGSLYTGEGHSRIYEDDAVYDLAVSFALETDSQVGVPTSQRTIVVSGSNPYILPFAMRGILEEDFVKKELQREVSELLQEFDDWKPTSKALKDVKFRLEGIRSQL